MITCKTTVNSKEPLISHSVSSKSWNQIAMDIMTISGKNYLITVDVYSDFWELDTLPNSPTAASLIQCSQILSVMEYLMLFLLAFDNLITKSLINLQKNGSLNALHQIHIIASQKEKLNQPWKQLRSLSRNQNRVVVIDGLDWIGQIHQQRNQVVVQNNTWCLGEQRPNYQQLMPYWSLMWILMWRKC